MDKFVSTCTSAGAGSTEVNLHCSEASPDLTGPSTPSPPPPPLGRSLSPPGTLPPGGQPSGCRCGVGPGVCPLGLVPSSGCGMDLGGRHLLSQRGGSHSVACACPPCTLAGRSRDRALVTPVCLPLQWWTVRMAGPRGQSGPSVPSPVGPAPSRGAGPVTSPATRAQGHPSRRGRAAWASATTAVSAGGRWRPLGRVPCPAPALDVGGGAAPLPLPGEVPAGPPTPLLAPC